MTDGRVFDPLPRLGLGCGGALAWPYLTDPEQALRTLLGAHAAGIRFFDTGHAYCAGHAETLLGRAIREIGRDRLFIGTKVGTFAVGRWGRVTQRFDRASLESSLMESLRRLGVDQVDLLMLHSPPDAALQSGMETLQWMRARGMTCRVGASIKATQCGHPAMALCDTVMLQHSAVAPAPDGTIDSLRRMGIAVIAKRPIQPESTGGRALLVPRSLDRAGIWYWLRGLRNRARGSSRAGVSTPRVSPGKTLVATLASVDGAVFGSRSLHHIRENVDAVRSAGITLG
ncbi:MAG: aldo/keto reductase [Actinobacteria bacterium]|nr:aldo/keto reductase [Actinomycetota bacterium]